MVARRSAGKRAGCPWSCPPAPRAPPAREHHAQALAIARQLGAPLEEARALEGLGHTQLQDANPGQAAAHLRQALAIYQHIGAPAAQRVQQTLQNHQLASATERRPAQTRERQRESGVPEIRSKALLTCFTA